MNIPMSIPLPGYGWIRSLMKWRNILAASSVALPMSTLAQETKSTFTVEDIRAWSGQPIVRQSERVPGYRGIWFTLGFKFKYGDKYSGGLGTYTSNHEPMAVYSPSANKTFFTYGGTSGPEKRELAIMVSYFDHATGKVPKPVLLYFDPSVDDPHDNASIQLDKEGYVWVFKSGRGTKRPGIIFRSTKPGSIDAFECVSVQEFTYPQVWYDDAKGFFLLFTKYKFAKGRGPARELYWKSSVDGRVWTEDKMLAGFEGHYQTSGHRGDKIVTFFNWHPGSDVDKRTNLYFAQTTDRGKTWTTADGKPLKLPLDAPKNEALVVDYKARGMNMYTCDVNFDKSGNPILLFVTSHAGEPGPAGDPREWTVMHWTQGKWETHIVTQSGHNYDMGSIYVKGDEWRIVGPTGAPPQKYGTGGEMVLWVSPDEGKSWNMKRQLTGKSPYNHSYARRPASATDPFFAFWADGDPTRLTKSHLFFTDSTGDHVRRLPYDMKEDFEAPEPLQ